jgi:ankyrin repeat protein
MSLETKSQHAETSRLLSLPPELFLMIANQLDTEDRAALFACSSSLAQTYVPIQATYIDKSGQNLLIGAILMGFYTLARALLTHGADPNLADPLYKHTSLHRVVDRQDVVAVRLLLEFGADTNLVDKRHWFPLHFAAERDSAQMVELLADAGASLDVGKAYTPLELASFNGNINAVRMLLRKGADPDMAPPHAVPSILLAAEKEHAEIAVALIEAGASMYLMEAMYLSGRAGRVAVVKAMVETGKEEVRKMASLVLLKAMGETEESREMTETVQVLLDAGIVVDKTTLELATARWGLFRKHAEMLRRYDADLATPSLQ